MVQQSDSSPSSNASAIKWSRDISTEPTMWSRWESQSFVRCRDRCRNIEGEADLGVHWTHIYILQYRLQLHTKREISTRLHSKTCRLGTWLSWVFVKGEEVYRGNCDQRPFILKSLGDEISRGMRKVEASKDVVPTPIITVGGWWVVLKLDPQVFFHIDRSV